MDKLEYIPGDLVTNKYYTKVLIVKKTVKNMVYTQNRDAFSDTYLLHKDDVVPMLLSPDILEKNGWKKQNKVPINCTILYNLHNEITIGYNTNSKTFVYDFGINKLLRIRFIHQLQHLLFGLGINSEMEV